MKQHEREFFISQIRYGTVLVDGDIEIRPAKIKDTLLSTKRYDEAYEEALDDEMMTEAEVHAWMLENGLWSRPDQQAIDKALKDIERLKVEIYNAWNNDRLRERIRKYIRAAENFYAKKMGEKHVYLENTAEGFAKNEQLLFLVQRTTFKDDKPYDFSELSPHELVAHYVKSICSESCIRELARTEPWKSLWNIRESLGEGRLFCHHPDSELTLNQKGLLNWSQIYDNIQESVDCPSSEIINDDDMLDGWFIVQQKKREHQKSQKDFEDSTKSGKIKNSSEVFVMAGSQKDKDRIDNMNTVHGNAIKQQRYNLIKQKGSVGQNEFADEKLRMRTQATSQFKNAMTRR